MKKAWALHIKEKFMIEGIENHHLAELKMVYKLIAKKNYIEASKRGKVLAEEGIYNANFLINMINATLEIGDCDGVMKSFYPLLQDIYFDKDNDKKSKLVLQEYSLVKEVAIKIMEEGRLDDALKFLNLFEKENALLISLLQTVKSLIVEAEKEGKIISDNNKNKEINQIASVVWGEKYIESFMSHNVRSMLAKGNIPALKEKGSVIHSIVTTPSGKELIEKHPVFAELSNYAKVEFFCFPESLVKLAQNNSDPDQIFYLLYGALDHVNIFFARSLKSNLFLIPVDSIVANPSFKNMRSYLDQGYDCCGAGNLVAESEGFLSELDEKYGTSGDLTISTKDLATLALKHPHHYITSQLIHDKNKDFGRYPRELFWPTKGGVYVHSIYTHPLVVSAERITSDYKMPFKWVDFLLPARLFQNKEAFDHYKIIDNAEEAYINNYAGKGRKFETTGRAFKIKDFVEAHLYSHPIHRHMLHTRQFIPCDYEPLKCSNNIDRDIRKIKKELAKVFDEPDLMETEYSQKTAA